MTPYAAEGQYLASVNTVKQEARALKRHYGWKRPNDGFLGDRWFDMRWRIINAAFADMEQAAITLQAHGKLCVWHPQTERKAA